MVWCKLNCIVRFAEEATIPEREGALCRCLVVIHVVLDQTLGEFFVQINDFCSNPTFVGEYVSPCLVIQS